MVLPAICIGKFGLLDPKCPPNSQPLPPMFGGSVGGHFPFGGSVGGHLLQKVTYYTLNAAQLIAIYLVQLAT